VNVIRLIILNSVITEHKVMLSHDFNWNNVEILNEKKFSNKRLISEMILYT